MFDNDGLTSMMSPQENDETPDFTVNDVSTLKEMLLALEKVVDEMPLFQGSETKKGGYIFSILEKANVSPYF